MNIPRHEKIEISRQNDREFELLLDDEMAMLISGAANHSSKLVLIASMNPTEIYSAWDTTQPRAVDLFEKAQTGFEKDGWVPASGAAFDYFTASLAPVGMVAKEYIDDDHSRIGYQLTELGEERGIPLAGLLLDFAARHDLAMSQVFGDTVSRNPEARSGEIRWKLFQGLATQQTNVITSIKELAESVDSNPARTLSHLSELSKIGLLHYESGQKSRVWIDNPQQEVITELVQLLENIQNGNETVIAQGKHLAKSILANPEVVSRLLRHERDVSVHYQGRINAKKRGERVLNILRSEVESLSYEDIQKKLIDMGDIVSKKGIARIIKLHNDINVEPVPGGPSKISINKQ